MKKILRKFLLSLIVLYSLMCLVIYIYPLPFFYNPSSRVSNIEHAHAYGYPAQEVKYTASDGTPLFAWFTAPKKGKKIIVFMHGNSHNVEEFYYKMKTFANDGYGTMIPEYRGFGGLDGKINQKNLENDAIAAIKYLNKQGYKNSDIYVYGMSLGSHMATHSVHQLQSAEKFAGLILEVPFDSLLHTAQSRVPFLPLSLIVRDKYDNITEIQEIQSPILIMGGTIDETIPIELAINLYNHAPSNKKMIIYKNGKHSNLFNFRNDLDVLTWIENNEKGIK